jgi:hypothetical protein
MKFANARALIVGTVAACSLLWPAVLPSFAMPQSSNSPKQSAQTNKDREDRGPEPIVNIDGPLQDSTPDAIRHERNRRHDLNSGHPLQEPPPGEDEASAISSGHQALPALPVRQSDTIVIGSVTNASAFLSNAKDFVYSEFLITISDILMSSAVPLQNGNSVDGFRVGGAVRFPSGRIWRFRVFEQGMPRVGGRYVFFLKSNPQTSDFRIITGYLLQNGKIQPLDGIGYHHVSAAALPFTKYKDADETTLLNDVKEAILKGAR